MEVSNLGFDFWWVSNLEVLVEDDDGGDGDWVGRASWEGKKKYSCCYKEQASPDSHNSKQMTSKLNFTALIPTKISSYRLAQFLSRALKPSSLSFTHQCAPSLGAWVCIGVWVWDGWLGVDLDLG